MPLHIIAKRTTTIQATIRDAQKIVKKQKKPRTSTISETIATSTQGFKPKKKPTATRTMLATIAESQAQMQPPSRSQWPRKPKRLQKRQQERRHLLKNRQNLGKEKQNDLFHLSFFTCFQSIKKIFLLDWENKRG